MIPWNYKILSYNFVKNAVIKIFTILQIYERLKKIKEVKIKIIVKTYKNVIYTWNSSFDSFFVI